MSSFDDLLASDRDPVCPFDIELAGKPLHIAEWLRVLPGKRYVGRGHWQSNQVLAKLFVGRSALRKAAAEKQGAGLLAQAGIRSPELISEGHSTKGAWVLYQYLDNAESLSKQLDLQTPDAWLQAAVHLIAQMHDSGLQQKDLHLDNFIVYEGDLWLVDAADVHGDCVGPLAAEDAASNLGLFFAQLAPAMETRLLIEQYNAVAKVQLKPESVHQQVHKWRLWRAQNLMTKSVRDCTLFSVTRDWSSFSAVRRDEKESLSQLLQDPDSYVDNGKPLKQGGSATVSLVDLAGRQLVVKRYNIKNWRHALSRCWRPSRAWHSWQMANALPILGIDTPTPLAMIERRWGWLRRGAYLITSYDPGQDIIRQTQDQLEPQLEQALVQMMDAMKRARFSHGDLKGTNLLYGGGQLSVIDLDAVTEHHNNRSFTKAYSKDRSRLLRNWPKEHPVRQRLDQLLPG